MRSILAAVALMVLSPVGVLAGPRLDQVQVIGTHNSYHLQPHPSLEQLIRSRSPEDADSLAYTHVSLTRQFEEQGIRQIELDVYADPDGGRFADPMGRAIATRMGLPVPPLRFVEALRRPGAKILHVPDFDYGTTVATFRDALTEIARWSAAHPAHLPIAVMVEFKSEPAGAEFTPTIPWTFDRVLDLEREILSVFGTERLITPDLVRRGAPSLRDAITAHGWPELAGMRGRILFAMDNEDALRDAYLTPSSTLEGRLLFTSVAEDHPAAAWFKINDPIGSFDRIRRLAGQGFLIRTRADVGTREARTGEGRMRDAAFASGAQWISTDFPVPHLPWSDYSVHWTNAMVGRANPVSASAWPADLDLEALAPPGLEPFPARELELLNARAFARHRERCLTEASRDYARLLELDPVRMPSAAEQEAIRAFAPRLQAHSREPFRLAAVVAVHHPQRALIAYHLFWDDDIDYPEDNDPTDHEVVWVGYDPALQRAQQVWTYFHGTLLTAALPPGGGGRPEVAVEWGKHGSLPRQADGRFAEPAQLRAHWVRLVDTGTRLPNHPLAKGWPSRFEGTWEDYRDFTRSIETADRLAGDGSMWTSAWGNAVLDQHALTINFAPKTEWPE